jgi:signal transduction histidine kinase
MRAGDALSTLEPGAHVCLPFASPEDQHTIVSSFLAEGLRRGEKCVFASAPAHLSAVEAQLVAQGFPVEELRQRGALVLSDTDVIYRQNGVFDPEASLAAIPRAVEQARAAGFTGYRGAGGPPRPTSDADERARLLAYEASVTEVLRIAGAAAICLCDRHTTHPDTIYGMLRTHPLAVIGGQVCPNPFFAPAEGAAGTGGQARRVEWMLEALARQRAAEADLRARQDALIDEVVRLSRESERLRGREASNRRDLDTRNSLLGALARQVRPPVAALRTLLEESGLDGRATIAPDLIDRMREHADRLARLCDQLDSLRTFVSAEPTLHAEPVELVALVRQALDQWRAGPRRGTAEVRLSAGRPVEGSWDRNRLCDLLGQLLRVAWDRGWGTPIDVAAEDLGSRARLVVVYRDMEVAAGSPLEPCASEAVVGAAQERLALEVWIARETARGMGGALGTSVWPDGRVSLTLDLPRQRPE